jgi:asparagine synthase (glutamine-hydrolysing)
MCGIVGIVSEALPEKTSEELTCMMASMAHRGPDGGGIWRDPQGRCALGHKRLAIIDPSGGAQPLGNADGTVWITFNGCIYNYKELAQTLRQKGYTFQTQSDTEVIVRAYEAWGTDCVKHFNGMWAFAIWDSRRQMLFCSRDRVGIKPFYYVDCGGRFVFASEIKALLADGTMSAEPDADGLRQYLSFQLCLEDRSVFRGVQR